MNEDTEPATLEDLDDEERFLDSLREDTFTAVQTESVRGKMILAGLDVAKQRHLYVVTKRVQPEFYVCA